MKRTCNVCGGETRVGTRYATQGDEKALISLPTIECTSCGAIHPDSERISALPFDELPTSVRAERRLPVPRHVGDTLSPPPLSASGSGGPKKPKV